MGIKRPKMTRDFEKDIISLFFYHECLWKKTCPLHGNMEATEKALDLFVTKYEENGQTVSKGQVKVLLNYYKKMVRKAVQRRMINEKYKPKSWQYPNLIFLEEQEKRTQKEFYKPTEKYMRYINAKIKSEDTNDSTSNDSDVTLLEPNCLGGPSHNVEIKTEPQPSTDAMNSSGPLPPTSEKVTLESQITSTSAIIPVNPDVEKISFIPFSEFNGSFEALDTNTVEPNSSKEPSHSTQIEILPANGVRRSLSCRETQTENSQLNAGCSYASDILLWPQISEYDPRSVSDSNTSSQLPFKTRKRRNSSDDDDAPKRVHSDFTENDFKIMGEHIGNKLRKLPHHLMHHVEHVINMVIYEAEEAKYEEAKHWNICSFEAFKTRKRRNCSGDDDAPKRVHSDFTENDFKIMGEHIGNKIRKLPHHLVHHVEHMINMIIYEAEEGKMNKSTNISINNNSCC